MTPEQLKCLGSIEMVELIEYVSHELAVLNGAVTTVEFVLEDGLFQKAYVKLGPIRSKGIEARLELVRARKEGGPDMIVVGDQPAEDGPSGP